MEQNQIPSPSKPTYEHRIWMNNNLFSMKGKTYKIVSGTWMPDGRDAIKFENVPPPNESDYPVSVYCMPEEEFFTKVDKTKLKSA